MENMKHHNIRRVVVALCVAASALSAARAQVVTHGLDGSSRHTRCGVTAFCVVACLADARNPFALPEVDNYAGRTSVWGKGHDRTAVRSVGIGTGLCRLIAKGARDHALPPRTENSLVAQREGEATVARASDTITHPRLDRSVRAHLTDAAPWGTGRSMTGSARTEARQDISRGL